MASARSLAALCRATFSLCSAASTSAGPAALGAGLLRAAAAGGAAAAPALQQQQACAAAGLRQLVRHFHSSLASGAAAEEGGASPAINPLQQAPMPAATPSRPDFGLGPLAAAEEGGNTSRAVSRGISISPQKLNDFAKLVRGLHIEDALIQCRISPKKAAKIVEKALVSAQANAVTNQGLEEARLRVAEAWVGKGQHMKRVSMHGRGRSGRRLRYKSHLTVVLREEETEPRRRTRVIPMLMERDRQRRVRAAAGQAAQ